MHFSCNYHHQLTGKQLLLSSILPVSCLAQDCCIPVDSMHQHYDIMHMRHPLSDSKGQQETSVTPSTSMGLEQLGMHVQANDKQASLDPNSCLLCKGINSHIAQCSSKAHIRMLNLQTMLPMWSHQVAVSPNVLNLHQNANNTATMLNSTEECYAS